MAPASIAVAQRRRPLGKRKHLLRISGYRGAWVTSPPAGKWPKMRRVLVACAIVAVLAALGSLGFALGSGVEINISQKGRAFMPAAVEINKGDTLAIRNDDEYIHQVYVASSSFNFDFGRTGYRPDRSHNLPGPRDLPGALCHPSKDAARCCGQIAHLRRRCVRC